MKVSLDLRPRAVVAAQKKQLNVARLFLVLFLVTFFLIGTATLVRAGFLFRSLKSSVRDIRNELQTQETSELRLNNELKRLAEEEALYVSALKILRDELPGLEFLQSLENSLPLGVWIQNISVLPGRATLQGRAYKEDDVVEFGKGLLDEPVVAAVDFPVTSRVAKDGQSLVDFSLACSLRDFEASNPVPATPVTIEGGE
ncbi:MAG: PilN domain-containing protein [Aminobacteriaceae bacterium]